MLYYSSFGTEEIRQSPPKEKIRKSQRSDSASSMCTEGVTNPWENNMDVLI
jgi:hypothetical protein